MPGGVGGKAREGLPIPIQLVRSASKFRRYLESLASLTRFACLNGNRTSDFGFDQLYEWISENSAAARNAERGRGSGHQVHD
jgi:hypothetical protein